MKCKEFNPHLFWSEFNLSDVEILKEQNETNLNFNFKMYGNKISNEIEKSKKQKENQHFPLVLSPAGHKL